MNLSTIEILTLQTILCAGGAVLPGSGDGMVSRAAVRGLMARGLVAQDKRTVSVFRTRDGRIARAPMLLVTSAGEDALLDSVPDFSDVR